MTFVVRQSTAATVDIGPFLDETDGRTIESALTLSQADIRLSKNGAAFAQKSESSSATHMENGYYSCAIDTTDTNTVGRLTLAVNESGALPVWHQFQVVEEAVYDALYAASAAGYATAGSLSTVDTNVSAIKTKTDALTFTVANVVDSNIQRVNDVVVTGTGTVGDEWGP